MKQTGTEHFLPRLQEMFDGWAKEDPPTMEKLPLEVDVTELLAKIALMVGSTELTKGFSM